MDETVLATHEVYECAEINQVDDLTVINLADFCFFNDARNPLTRGFDLRDVGRRNLDKTFVINVDLRAGGGDDFANDLATGTDDVADLRFVDLHGFDTWRMRGQLATRFAQCLGHFTQDMRAACLGLVQCSFKNFAGNTGNLDVHLHRGDAFGRTSYLEIHVAEMIFITQNI